MNRIVRSALALALGFGVAITAINVSDDVPGDKPGTNLGQLNIDSYCQRAFDSTASAMTPTGDAYGWKCLLRHNGLFTSVDVDVSLACQTMFGAPAYAQSFDTSNRYSWQCFRGPNPGRPVG
ncbi:MAG: hypothetical protein ABIQ39_09655 [Ilumatobacteraceae bacterium]